MKKNVLSIIIIYCIILLSLFSLFIIYMKPLNNNDTTEITSAFITDTEITVTYYEGDEDLNYNFISNINKLDSFTDFPYSAIQSFGDNVNDFLTTSGYTMRSLNIETLKKESTEFKFVISISDSNDILKGTYYLADNSFNFYLVKE